MSTRTVPADLRAELAGCKYRILAELRRLSTLHGDLGEAGPDALAEAIQGAKIALLALIIEAARVEQGIST
ncbi:MAG: hypothetical protein A2V70_18180 [Planctomycetes bacterium RBG_13_63_9]|nr:MAG: hypothetical protein A2V70_18180 [Planctomycetes bacterium RBG_13_63_9]